MSLEEARSWQLQLERDLLAGSLPNCPKSIAYVSAGLISWLLRRIKELEIELEVMKAVAVTTVMPHPEYKARAVSPKTDVVR